MIKLLFLILSLTPNSYYIEPPSIRIEHIGSQDKPIFTIIICQTHEKCKELQNSSLVIVKPEEMKILVDFISQRKVKNQKFNGSLETGAFRITLFSGSQTDFTYDIIERVKSIKYFSELIDLVDSGAIASSDLKEYLQSTIERIGD